MTSPAAGHRPLTPTVLGLLVAAALLATVALSAAIVGGSRVHCPSASDSSPSRPLAAQCAPAVATK